MDKTTYFYPNTTLRCGAHLLDLSSPKIMGILNVTPDSFYDGGRFADPDAACAHAEKMIRDGASLIDIGAASSRPGAGLVGTEEELRRILPVIDAVHTRFPECPLSVDTWRGRVAEEAVAHGACMINDISAGSQDPTIHDVAARHKVPYVLMHMQGTPQHMQDNPQYEDVVAEVLAFFIEKCLALQEKGVEEILLDPGFGFGKTLEHNYTLLRNFHVFGLAGFPVMAGISRKRMVCSLLHVNPGEALNGSTAIHTMLILKGARILRVHDVREAAEVLKITEAAGM